MAVSFPVLTSGLPEVSGTRVTWDCQPDQLPVPCGSDLYLAHTVNADPLGPAKPCVRDLFFFLLSHNADASQQNSRNASVNV